MLLQYGPKDMAESQSGVPQIAWSLWATPWEGEDDKDKFVDFLNGVLAYVSGDDPEWVKAIAAEKEKWADWVSRGPE